MSLLLVPATSILSIQKLHGKVQGIKAFGYYDLVNMRPFRHRALLLPQTDIRLLGLLPP